MSLAKKLIESLQTEPDLWEITHDRMKGGRVATRKSEIKIDEIELWMGEGWGSRANYYSHDDEFEFGRSDTKKIRKTVQTLVDIRTKPMDRALSTENPVNRVIGTDQEEIVTAIMASMKSDPSGWEKEISYNTGEVLLSKKGTSLQVGATENRQRRGRRRDPMTGILSFSNGSCTYSVNVPGVLDADVPEAMRAEFYETAKELLAVINSDSAADRRDRAMAELKKKEPGRIQRFLNRISATFLWIGNRIPDIVMVSLAIGMISLGVYGIVTGPGWSDPRDPSGSLGPGYFKALEDHEMEERLMRDLPEEAEIEEAPGEWY